MTGAHVATKELKHWTVETDGDNICWLTLDKADSSSNTLSQAVLAELEDAVGWVAARRPIGVVIRSAKKSGFILGVDVNEFVGLTSAAQATAVAARGQELMARIAALADQESSSVAQACSASITNEVRLEASLSSPSPASR